MILRREMATVLFDFEYRRQTWIERSELSTPPFNSGYVSYCLKQVDLWRSLRQDVFDRLKDAMIVSLCDNLIIQH